jgi:glyoxylase-like metal-dependent hydrolase (beta-lactamase superfamily II)
MQVHVLVTGRFFPRLGSTVVLLEPSDGGRILVDSGAGQDAPRLLRGLDDLGLRPDDVDTVIATHLHYDHCGNHLLFERARYLVNADDYRDAAAFAATFLADGSPDKRATAEALRARTQTIKPFYLRSIVREMERNLPFYERVLEGDPRFVLLPGGQRLGDDVEVLPTPSHTRGHLSVVARGAATGDHGAPADLLVAGDALASRAIAASGGGREVDLASDVRQYRRTRRALLRDFRFVVPGHDAPVDLGRATATEAAA